jgi:4'-phosphopantetheinyl transferase
MTTPLPPSVPPLPPGHVHVWRVSLAVDPSTLTALELLLSADERQRADRFAFPELRRRFIVTRANLRQLLGRYADRPAAGLRFTYGPAGKPGLSGGGWHFNVSHSGEQALIAVAAEAHAGGSGGPGVGGVGVDIERVRSLDYDAMARGALPAADLISLSQAPPSAKADTFFRLWVRHEAQVKALGLGIGALADVPVYDLELDPEYRAAIATAISDAQIKVFADLI